MRLLTLVTFASLAMGIPAPQPRETGRAPAHAPMARRAVTQQEARAHLEALAAAQAEARAQAVEARQNGGGGNVYEPLLRLASLAGIPLPTDPGVLLGLAPEASKLLKALPTGAVLTALETAAPSGFISKIVHDPSFAASFESAFAAGSSPSWFLGLPTSILSYLHTYNGIETVAGELGTVIASVTKAESSALKDGSSATSSKKSASTASQTGGIVVTDTNTPTAQSTAQQSSSSVSSSSSAGAAAHGPMAQPTGKVLGFSAAAAALVLGAAAVM